MTDERDKPSRIKNSSARTTARDVPFVRDAGSDAEPAPRGQRPEHLPRDPTYEAELAQVELAVLRNPERRDDPSTKQGGRRGYELKAAEAPESVTPESPGTRAGREAPNAKSPTPPSSNGRSAASGTLLSVGSVDPRGKTERTLETPRMYFSQTDAGSEVYFKPGKIPAVTVHQTLETETVKLSDSIDPRRAKTLPRIDRQALARFAESERPQESAAPLALAGPGSSVDFGTERDSVGFSRDDDELITPLGEHEDGQIHASLSPFRDQAEPSYTFDGVPTRVEPLAARRASDPPFSVPLPDPSAIPTQRDLPMHRIEASLPPPPALPSLPSLSDPVPTVLTAHAAATSEAPSPTSAPVELDERVRKPIWLNVAAFAVALVLTIFFGLWLTRSSEPDAASEAARPAPLPQPAALAAEAPPVVAPPATPSTLPSPPSPPPPPSLVTGGVPRAAAASAPGARSSAAVPRKSAAPPANASSPRKPAPPKVTRETIF
jgi:hypothetical protein